MSLSYEPVQHTEKVKKRRAKFAKAFPNKSLTVQADKDRCCVNNIMARYRKTGLVDHVRQHEGRYGDFTTAGDFQEAMSVVASAQQSFDLLPAEVRKRFDNDPAEFLDFVAKEDNFPELVKMGLAKARPISTEDPSKELQKEPDKASDAE